MEQPLAFSSKANDSWVSQTETYIMKRLKWVDSKYFYSSEKYNHKREVIKH